MHAPDGGREERDVRRAVEEAQLVPGARRSGTGGAPRAVEEGPASGEVRPHAVARPRPPAHERGPLGPGEGGEHPDPLGQHRVEVVPVSQDGEHEDPVDRAHGDRRVDDGGDDLAAHAADDGAVAIHEHDDDAPGEQGGRRGARALDRQGAAASLHGGPDLPRPDRSVHDAGGDGGGRLERERRQEREEDGEPVLAVALDHAPRPVPGAAVDERRRGPRGDARTGAREGDELLAAALGEVGEDGAHERGHTARGLAQHLEPLLRQPPVDHLGELGGRQREAGGRQDEVEDGRDGEVPDVDVDDDEQRRDGQPRGEQLGAPVEQLPGARGAPRVLGSVGAPVDEDAADGGPSRRSSTSSSTLRAAPVRRAPGPASTSRGRLPSAASTADSREAVA